MKILVIDDSSLYQKIHVKLLKTHLKEAEYLTASNGWEGYQIFEKEEPDFIILDLLMPVMNGIEFLKLFRDKHPNSTTRIIVLSADVQRMVKEEVMEMGAVGFVHKPLTEERAREIADDIRRLSHA